MKAPSEIVGKNVEEIITTWNAELVRAAWLPGMGAAQVAHACARRVPAPRRPALKERQTRAFGTHARALADWDRHIFRNRRTLSALESEIKRVSGAQDALERQLSILEVHQREIHEALQGMEHEAETLFDKEGPRQDEASRERDALFAAAEDVSKQLLDISAALRETIQMVRRRARPRPRRAKRAC